MRISVTVMAAMALAFGSCLSVSASAEETKSIKEPSVSSTPVTQLPLPAAPAQPDPNKIVTMTVSELNALLAFERASALASGAIAKINAQINAPSTPPK